MSARPDPRSGQKALNFSKALRALERSVASPVTEPRDLSGIVKDFEIAYELSWKSLKAYLENQGHESGKRHLLLRQYLRPVVEFPGKRYHGRRFI